MDNVKVTVLTHKENELHNRLIVAEFNLGQVEEELRRLDEVNAELVEALKYCREKIAYMTTHGEWYSPGRAIEKADAALAKAQGDNNEC